MLHLSAVINMSYKTSKTYWNNSAAPIRHTRTHHSGLVRALGNTERVNGAESCTRLLLETVFSSVFTRSARLESSQPLHGSIGLRLKQKHRAEATGGGLDENAASLESTLGWKDDEAIPTTWNKSGVFEATCPHAPARMTDNEGNWQF